MVRWADAGARAQHVRLREVQAVVKESQACVETAVARE